MLSHRLAAFSIRHARRILFGWLFLASCAVWFALQLPQALGDHGLTTQGSSAQAKRMLADHFGLSDEPVVLVFERGGGADRQAFDAFIRHSLAEAARIEGVRVAASPLGGPGMERGRYAYALLSVPDSADGKREAVDRLRAAMPRQPGFGVSLTGKPAVQEDVNRSSRHDLKTAEAVGVPVALALLAFTFGGLLPALIPILAGGLAVVIAMGALEVVGTSGPIELSVFVYNVVPMVGMAVCVDYALLMVGRYREEKAARFSDRDALATTLATSGRAVAVSAACVLLALAGTFWIRMPIFNSVAVGAMAVLVLSAAINLTLVPALLHLLGDRLIPARTSGRPRRLRGGLLARFTTVVLNRPLRSAAAALGLLFVCWLPLRDLQVAVPGPDSLPAGTESREAAAIVAERFRPAELSQAFFLIGAEGRGGESGGGGRGGEGRRGQASANDNSALAAKIRFELARDAKVMGAEAYPSLDGSGVYLLDVRLRGGADSPGVREWVRDRQRQYEALNVRIGGEPKYLQEVRDEIFGRAPYVLAFAALSNFAVLAWAFRSLLLPVKAVAMNLLSIGAALGIVAWLFEGGRWGLEATDVAIMIPVFLFGLTFGISMDYGVFLLSRIYERYKRDRNNDAAIREGLGASAAVITSAAAIMIAVTAPFALAGVSGVKQLGIGIAAALFLDATIVRLILVPSLMRLFGRWNWWSPFA